MILLKERDNDGFFTVSNAFTDAYLGTLSGDAVKLYLYIKRCYTDGNELFFSDAANALRITKDALKSAVDELSDAGIIIFDGDNLILKADSSLRDAAAKKADDDLRKKLTDKTYEDGFTEVVRSINNEFFAGKMSFRWYDLIKKCAGEYGFQPETIYILFASCKNIRERSSTASFYNYIAKVAENWYADRIVTPEDVAEREKKTVELREYVDFVMKKLSFRRPFTMQERAVVESWQKKGVTTDMLSVILDDTNSVSALTIAKIEVQVRHWVDAGLKNAEDVKKYYDALRAERAAQMRSKDSAPKTSAAPDTQKHFNGERKYNNDFYEWLENRDAPKNKNKG